MMNAPVPHLPLTRREMLRGFAGGFGALALSGMLADLANGGTTVPGRGSVNPLAPQAAHFSPRAKRVIFLYMTGGVSHVESFDHKPRLFADHGKTLTVDNWQGAAGQFTRYFKRPNWGFQAGGSCGAMVSDLFPHVRSMMDDVCLIRSMESDHTNHYESTLGMHTGSFNFARPSIGSWVSYGLGTENQNLPAFMVIAPAVPYAGTQTWGSDFLPGCHQGTHVVPGPTPVADVTRRVPTDELQAMELELLGRVNRRHQAARPADAALEARIKSFETAAGMQRQVPEAFDLTGETDDTLALYGVQRGANTGFGWQCLVARRLVERGVRFVELLDVGSSNNWDSHGDMADHARLAANVDQPMAALLRDLKRRGMLDDTLVVWTTEFGRTPFNNSADAKGREHHPWAFSSWLAGAGVNGGTTYGTTDEHGVRVATDGVHVHDLHATILHLLGLDHERLTYRHAGRDFRLTDVAGNVVSKLLA